jgi:acyl dehydratase
MQGAAGRGTVSLEQQVAALSGQIAIDGAEPAGPGSLAEESPMTVQRFPVEASHILMFARAIGDEDPAYCDPEQARQTEADGIIAPPTFVAASAQFDPNNRLRPRPGAPWMGSGKEPTSIKRPPAQPSSAQSPGQSGKAPSPALHAEQHYEYHRHLRPGDVLTAKSKPGKTWEKDSKRAGKLRFNESIVEYFDQHGQLVITARHVGVVPERAVDSTANKG